MSGSARSVMSSAQRWLAFGRTAETRRTRRLAERRCGFTMVELLLAVGLFSILVVALLRLVDTSLTIWRRSDQNRELLEMGGAVMDLLAEDVHALEGGPRGDLLSDWALFDLDQDGINGAPRPRLRLVRHVNAASLQRLGGGAPGSSLETFERGLAQVGWALLPSTSDVKDERQLGTLVRGMRLLGDKDTLSFFDDGFFDASGKPPPGSLNEITGGVLWFELAFASQTSIVHDGWKVGDELADCASSWDAWNRALPSTEVTVLNRAPAGMPRAKDVPLLPRRVRITLELERPADLRNRTRVSAALTEEATILEVRDGRDLPAAGGMVLVGDEWMKVLEVNGERAAVERGRRATRPSNHDAGLLVHWGWSSEREIAVDMTREDWDL